MADDLFQEILTYLEFTERDEERLHTLHTAISPRFHAIADRFNASVLASEGARKVLQSPGQARRLWTTLIAWLDRLLAGPWDQTYFEARCQIGRTHVRIGLAQQFMFAAMNVLRRELHDTANETMARPPSEMSAMHQSLDKALDLDLAIMLHTYREDLLSLHARSEQRLSVFGLLAASIGHDLRNPLGVIELSSDLLQRRCSGDPQSRKLLDRIREHVRISTGIIDHLLDIIQERPLSREPTDLARLVDAVASSVPRPEAVLLSVGGLTALPQVDVDPVQIRQIFANLIENAVHAAAPTGRVWVHGSAEPDAVVVRVEDDGPGVDPAILPRLFEPLVTTKKKGNGLGLALVKRLAERHGGEVSYHLRDPGGACFTLRIPL